MVVEAGILSQEQLDLALKAKGPGSKLGEFLIQKGFVPEEQIIDLISKQLRVKRYTPEAYPVRLEMKDIFSSELSQKFHAVPLTKQGSLLTVALKDPTDIDVLDSIEIYTNCEVEPVICSDQELAQLTTTLYGTQTNLDSMLEFFSEDEETATASTDSHSDVQLTPSSLQNMAEEAPVIRLVNSILSQAIHEKASDIHISPEKEFVQIRFRIDGRLREVPAPPKSMFLAIVSRIKILANMDITTSRIPQDGRFTINMDGREINVRVSSLPTIHGENIVMRLLDTSTGAYSLDELGIHADDRRKISKAMHKPYGMILSTGPTGSGKTTTLYSILKQINQPDINIITLEDPVEYRMEKIRQIQLNKKAGMTFASGLRSILRQDPDVVMVGEIRDHETSNIAVQAALTGHRLLSTVHTNDAAGAITRFIDMGIEPFLIASVLLISIAQRLVRRVCPHCKEAYHPDPRILTFWGLSADEHTFYHGKGCVHCGQSGYKGRMGIYEILLNDREVQDMILRRSSAQEITDAAHKAGKLRTLREDALEKILSGVTTIEEATKTVMV